MLYAPPRQIKEFPESNRLVATIPAGPRKLCTNGIVKFPILYPLIFKIENARSSFDFPALINHAVPIRITPPPSPRRLIRSMDGSKLIPEKLETIAAGSVIFSTILEMT